MARKQDTGDIRGQVHVVEIQCQQADKAEVQEAGNAKRR